VAEELGLIEEGEVVLLPETEGNEETRLGKGAIGIGGE